MSDKIVTQGKLADMINNGWSKGLRYVTETNKAAPAGVKANGRLGNNYDDDVKAMIEMNGEVGPQAQQFIKPKF